MFPNKLHMVMMMFVLHFETHVVDKGGILQTVHFHGMHVGADAPDHTKQTPFCFATLQKQNKVVVFYDSSVETLVQMKNTTLNSSDLSSLTRSINS